MWLGCLTWRNVCRRGRGPFSARPSPVLPRPTMIDSDRQDIPSTGTSDSEQQQSGPRRTITSRRLRRSYLVLCNSRVGNRGCCHLVEYQPRYLREYPTMPQRSTTHQTGIQREESSVCSGLTMARGTILRGVDAGECVSTVQGDTFGLRRPGRARNDGRTI